MKLNFWQWIGVGLLFVGVLLYFRRTANPPSATDATPNGITTPTTMPLPTTNP